MHEHLQHVRAQIHAGRVRKVLMDIPEGAGCPQKSIHRLIETTCGHTILFGSQLRVERTGIEENRGLLEGDRSLTTGHSRQRVEPLEVYSEASVGREEAPFYEIQLIVITKEQSDPRGVPGRCPRGLRNYQSFISILIYFIFSFLGFFISILFDFY